MVQLNLLCIELTLSTTRAMLCALPMEAIRGKLKEMRALPVSCGWKKNLKVIND
jgi:hypothetical protein